jgi:hypothetical protein
MDQMQWVGAICSHASMLSCSTAPSSYLWGFVVVKNRIIHHRREKINVCCYKRCRKRCLLLLGGGSAGAVDGLLNLTGKTVLGCVELGANGAVLGERSTDLLSLC